MYVSCMCRVGEIGGARCDVSIGRSVACQACTRARVQHSSIPYSCSSRSDFRETESELLVTVCALTDIITQSVSARA